MRVVDDLDEATADYVGVVLAHGVDGTAVAGHFAQHISPAAFHAPEVTMKYVGHGEIMHIRTNDNGRIGAVVVVTTTSAAQPPRTSPIVKSALVIDFFVWKLEW